jgi:hypothetical protein
MCWLLDENEEVNEHRFYLDAKDASAKCLNLHTTCRALRGLHMPYHAVACQFPGYHNR